MPRSVCFLFGQEGPGLSEQARGACDGTFSIAQFGSTRSINASAAAAIAMHAWIGRYADLGTPGGVVPDEPQPGGVAAFADERHRMKWSPASHPLLLGGCQ